MARGYADDQQAPESVALPLLEGRLGHRVAQDGPVAEEKLREANEAIARLMRSEKTFHSHSHQGS